MVDTAARSGGLGLFLVRDLRYLMTGSLVHLRNDL